ncbi:putative protein, unknown function [Plasmodium reichenowi]|uniref:6-cysteine protein n=1 Tax=Plasmodium reichenowi TaxID=5854 RepID=A0A151LW62_PLARE|nr:putative protein, unknown function [Plasmodium reichenowi]KYO03403.1 putative protein, unknown function [Plasmodium reichenowi]
MIQFIKCFLLFILLYSSDIIISIHPSTLIQNHLYMYQTNNSVNEENIYNMKKFSKLPIAENTRNIGHSTNDLYYEHSLNLEKHNEHFTLHNIKLMCQQIYHNQPNQSNLRILAVLLSTSYKQENISNIFQNLCNDGLSCLFTIQLSKNKTFVDQNKIVHLKIIDKDDLKRNKNNNIRHKITVYYICEDLNYKNQKQQENNEFKYVFNYEQLAFLKCENYLTVQVEKLVGINYNKEFHNLNPEYISFYCSQRVICNTHIEDLYKEDDNKRKNYIFYELTYRCVPPKVCSFCGNNSTCKLEKLYNKEKEITQFYNNVEYNDSGVFDRLLLSKEEEEERNKTSFIANLEYNAINYDIDDMITVGSNTYHILEICKCSKDYVQEGSSCVKKEKDKIYIRYAKR